MHQCQLNLLGILLANFEKILKKIKKDLHTGKNYDNILLVSEMMRV